MIISKVSMPEYRYLLIWLGIDNFRVGLWFEHYGKPDIGRKTFKKKTLLGHTQRLIHEYYKGKGLSVLPHTIDTLYLILNTFTIDQNCCVVTILLKSSTLPLGIKLCRTELLPQDHHIYPHTFKVVLYFF